MPRLRRSVAARWSLARPACANKRPRIVAWSGGRWAKSRCGKHRRVHRFGCTRFAIHQIRNPHRSLSHEMLTGRDPAIRGLPKHSSMRGSGYACSGADHRHSVPAPYETSSQRTDGQGKYIADTAFGLDDAGRTRVGLKLASEAEDLHIYAAVEHVFVNPCRLQEVLSGERSLWRIEERDQECVFPLRQCDRDAAGVRQTSRTTIELPTAKLAAALLGLSLRDNAAGLPPAQHSTYARPAVHAKTRRVWSHSHRHRVPTRQRDQSHRVDDQW